MKKTYRITGIDCPNCAKAIEGVIAKESFIEKVSLDYAKSKLYLVLKDENAEENLEKVIKTVKLIESNAEITDENEKSVNNKASTKSRWYSVPPRYVFVTCRFFACLFFFFPVSEFFHIPSCDDTRWECNDSDTYY